MDEEYKTGDAGLDSDLDLVKSEFDLHVLTGALKMFFRELKEPLFPFNTFDKFMNAIKMPNKSMKTQLFRDLIKVLPPYSKDTMRTLFEHLLRVINCSKENRMQIQNIAIVFGPTLLWPEQPAENVAMTLVLQNQIVDFILHEYKKLF
ncbi:Rho GTPase-activating protein 27 [Lamellibrachia satsuma]|nr:Rho GTPase-activating protein 27 [Lamellibrachia satsuma]